MYTNTSPYRHTHEQNYIHVYSSSFPHLCSVYLEWEQTSFFPSTGNWHFHKPSNDKYSIFRSRSVTHPLHHSNDDRPMSLNCVHFSISFVYPLTYDFAYIASNGEKQVRQQQQQQHRHHAVDFNATSCERVECVERCSVRKGCLLGFSGTMDLHRIFWLSEIFSDVLCVCVCMSSVHITHAQYDIEGAKKEKFIENAMNRCFFPPLTIFVNIHCSVPYWHTHRETQNTSQHTHSQYLNSSP